MSERQPSERIRTFNHHDPRHHEGLTDLWSEICAQPGLARSEMHGGFHVLARYEDVMTVAIDHETFVSGQGINIPSLPQHTPHIPVEMDPPEHGRFRQLLARVLTRARADAMKPRIRTIVRDLIAAMPTAAASGKVDFVQAFAKPLPIKVTLGLLGMPTSDATFLDHSLTTQRLKRGTDEGREAAMALVRYLEDQFSERRKTPGAPDDDILSAVLFGQIDGRPLTLDEQISIIRLLLFGGFDTTAMALARTMHWLAEHPEDADRLRRDDALLGKAVDEFIRHASPAGYIRRTVAQDTVLAGCPLKKGERVLMGFAAASHDPGQFECPEELRLDRKPTNHASFGAGVHRCIGSWLAKAEIQVAIGAFLAHYRHIAMDSGGEVRWECGENLGLASLPLVVKPA